eukprot:TRINITY_DN3855_c0_g1_i1.p1 TRINITY_DN3855_c0_g1~~TRINITY_DN3855_c0_g1_i1.p1  ORF type:complete len:1037 (+),score=352.69 TRINITY_DN3855_c0_g1_i1:103-3213(+)
MPGKDAGGPTHVAPEVLRMRESERKDAETMYDWLTNDEGVGLKGAGVQREVGGIRESRLQTLDRKGFRLIKPRCWDGLAERRAPGQVTEADDDWDLSFHEDGGEPTKYDVDWYLEWFWGSMAQVDPQRVPFPRKAAAAAKAVESERSFARHGLTHALPARWFCFRLVHDGPPLCSPRPPDEQRLWYYNFVTGESVWEPPHGLYEHAEAYERQYRFTKIRHAAEREGLIMPSGVPPAAAPFAADAAAVQRVPSGLRQRRSTDGSVRARSDGPRLTPDQQRSELLATGFGPGEDFYQEHGQEQEGHPGHPGHPGGQQQPERRARGAAGDATSAPRTDQESAESPAEADSDMVAVYARNIGIGVAACASVGAGVGAFTAACILAHGTAGMGAAMGALTGTPLGVGAGVFVTKHDELFPDEGSAVHSSAATADTATPAPPPPSGNAGMERRTRDVPDAAWGRASRQNPSRQSAYAPSYPPHAGSVAQSQPREGSELTADADLRPASSMSVEREIVAAREAPVPVVTQLPFDSPPPAETRHVEVKEGAGQESGAEAAAAAQPPVQAEVQPQPQQPQESPARHAPQTEADLPPAAVPHTSPQPTRGQRSVADAQPRAPPATAVPPPPAAGFDYWAVQDGGATEGYAAQSSPTVMRSRIPVGVVRPEREPSPPRVREVEEEPPGDEVPAAGSSSCAIPLPGEVRKCSSAAELGPLPLQGPTAYLLAPERLPESALKGEAAAELAAALREAAPATLIWDGSGAESAAAGALLADLGLSDTAFVGFVPPGRAGWGDAPAGFGAQVAVVQMAEGTSEAAYRKAVRDAGGRGDWHCFGGDASVARAVAELAEDPTHQGSRVFVYNLPSTTKLRELLELPATGTASAAVPAATEKRLLARLWEEVKEGAVEVGEGAVTHTERAVDWVQAGAKERDLGGLWDRVKDESAQAADAMAESTSAGAAALQEKAGEAADSDVAAAGKKKLGGWFTSAREAVSAAGESAAAASASAAESVTAASATAAESVTAAASDAGADIARRVHGADGGDA